MMTKYIILDRDGVINHESHAFIKSPAEWIPIPGSLEAIAKLHRAGFHIFVVTNQSGIARGLFNVATLQEIHKKMIDAVEKQGGHLEEIFFCPHHPDDHCECRKPKPALLYQIQKKYSVCLKDVFFVGDSTSDILTARAAQCRPLLVLTGNGKKTLETFHTENVPYFFDLVEAVDYVLQT